MGVGESATKHPKKWKTAIMELTTFTACALKLATYKWATFDYGTKLFQQLPSGGRKLYHFLPREMRTQVRAKKLKKKAAEKEAAEAVQLRMLFRAAGKKTKVKVPVVMK